MAGKKQKKRRLSSGLRLAIRQAGILATNDPKNRNLHVKGKYWLAEALGLKVQSLNCWNRIPRQHLMMIHRLTGVPLDKLDPMFKAS